MASWLRVVRRRPLLAAAWGLLIALAVVSRLVDLGDRAMSHDESIHAQLSWQLFEHDEYAHDPSYHGPLLFHVNAVVFELLGDSDFTARLAPALAGILLVVAPLLLRRHLGDVGALGSALLLAISPVVLFYGRYLRNDIYMALFAVLWVAGILGYLDSRRRRWLWLTTAAMAASFAAKETAFLTGASLGSFLALLALARHWRGSERWWQSASGTLAFSMLTLVLPFTAPLFYAPLGWDPVSWDGVEDWRRGLLTVGLLAATSVLAAWLFLRRSDARGTSATGESPRLRFRSWLALFGGFWGFQLLLFTSGFRDAPRGVISGVVGSLGYWLSQHEVERGAQPMYYYLILGGLYEFLPILTSLAAFVALLRLRAQTAALPTSGGTELDAPRHSSARSSPGRAIAPWLFAWWALSSWVGYSLAGERMPWLTVHLVLPMALLSGWWLGGLLQRLSWPAWRARDLAVPLLAPLLAVSMAGGLLTRPPFVGRGLDQIAETTRFLLALVLTMLSVAIIAVWLHRRRPRAGQARPLLLLGFVVALTVVTAQVSWRLSFQNDELATELMVYAHATPDIKVALEEVRRLSRRSGRGDTVPLAYDDGTSWPMSWYLRHWPGVQYFADRPGPQLSSYPIILATASNQDELWPFLGDDYASREYDLVWWPHEPATKFTREDVQRFFVDPERRRQVLDYVVHREMPAAFLERWPNRRPFRMYVARDLLAVSWGMPGDEQERDGFLVTELRVEPLDSWSGPYQELSLRMPTEIAVAEDGTRLIADAGNHRIVLLDADNEVIRTLGAGCSDEDASCPEPGLDLAEPSQLRLREPWGVVSLAGGAVAVADTWNGRILVFDAAGRVARSWGRPWSFTGGSPPPDQLYGPRGLAWDPVADRLLIADTGNHRLLELQDDEVRVAGGAGVVPGYFQEPVGLAVDPLDGTLLVADTWNRRIQRLDTELEPVASWPVPGWAGREPYNKPFLAVDARGLVYASDPMAARVLVFDRDGVVLGALVAAGWRGEPRAIPLGVAVAEDRLLVADAGQGLIWAIPLWSGAAEGSDREAP